MSTYEIRRSGATLCVSSVPGCGYDSVTLRDMGRNGHYLYRDGKKEKAAGRNSSPVGGSSKTIFNITDKGENVK